MKKQFDLNYYKAHPETKVVTRKENPVRIICTDRKNKEYPIVAMHITNSGFEKVDTYSESGKVILHEDSDLDLFMEVQAEYNFKPFDKVLVRDSEHQPWRPTLFSYIVDGLSCVDIACNYWNYVIPYEGNEDKCGEVTK